MITLPETNRSVKAVLFIYCCKGVSAGYCFLVKRIFAPAAHEKVWIFHYVKKTFYQRNFTSYICRFIKQTYGVLLQNIPVTHYWCTWAWYLSAYTSTADSDHVHLRFRYPQAVWMPTCTEGRLITKNNKKAILHPFPSAFGIVFALSFSVVSGFGIATFLR